MMTKAIQTVASSPATCIRRGDFNWAGWSLLSLLLFTAPVAVRAQFTTTTKDGLVTITGYNGPGGEVVIPNSINGRPVAAIGESAFVFQLGITRVTLPDSVTSIGAYAFLWCRNLLDVAIASNLTQIGSFAFQGCTSLESLTVDAANTTYSSADGVLFNKAQTRLIQCPQQKPGEYSIPGSVTHIESRAFNACANLQGIRVPRSVTSMGIEVFIGCSSLMDIEVDAENSAYSSLDGVLFNKSRTRLLNWPLGRSGDYDIPYGVAQVEENAFYGSPVANVTFPRSVRAIGTGAFDSCAALEGLYFLGDGPRVGANAFGLQTPAALYYLPGAAGWPKSVGGRPTQFWKLPEPVILSHASDFGPSSEGFGFRISWAEDADVVVEAATDLRAPVWLPVSTNTLVNGVSKFIDPHWTEFSTRSYRVVSP